MIREEHLWRQWYAWFPVMPSDDGVFWLEIVWRRRDPQSGNWEFKSLRTNRQKEKEAAQREI